MPEHQGPRRHAAIEIVVNGQSITSRLDPYLISCQVIDSYEGGHDECHIELDDRNAELQLPPDKVSIQVALGWSGTGPRLIDKGRVSAAGGQGPIVSTEEEKDELKWGGPGMELVFSGTVSEVESGFGRRSGGRRVWITGTSGNVMGKAKEPASGSWGEGKKDDASSAKSTPAGGSGAASSGGESGGGDEGVPLQQVLTEMFGKIGVGVKLSPEMKKIKRPFWEMTEQSPADFARSFAAHNGAIFKLSNGYATLVKKGEGVNADGVPMPTIEAQWGINLIGWRIKPYAGRPQWESASAKFFDIHAGEFEAITQKIGGSLPFGRAEAVMGNLQRVAEKSEAGQVNDGAARDSTSRRGTGWVLFNGDPRAKAGAQVNIINARPGVDGLYFMSEVEHNYTRGVGFTTRANVQFPSPKREEDIGWKNDPGRFDPKVKAAQDAEAKKKADAEQAAKDAAAAAAAAAEVPPSVSDVVRLLGGPSPLEKAIARRWFTDRGQAIPPEFQ